MNSDELPLSRSTIDRDALTRRDLTDVWADPDLRFIHVHRGDLAVRPGGERLHFTSVDTATRAAGGPGGLWAYLGTDFQGPVVAIMHTQLDEEWQWEHLRNIGAILPAREVGLATAAVALANWHWYYTHCPRCGHPTDVVESGWVRRCPTDGSEHYPRTDAAVIMAIVDSEERILLAHNTMWPENRYSVPAGYVEPGEPLEAAVRREVWEETGIRVGRVVYGGSQPWPFPASLMVGFRGEALDSAPIPDGEEISDARFFSRADLDAALAAGEVVLPGATSIARYLIEEWYGGPIDD